MIRHIFKAFCLFILLTATVAVPGHAFASLQLLNDKYLYHIRWNGIAIGRVIMEVSEDDARYTLSVDTKTRGIVDIFAPLRSFIQTTGRKDASGAYIPTIYKARSPSDDGDKHVELRYDRTGALTKRIREPLDDPNWRPEVPLTELVGIPDPLTGFLRFRKEYFKNVKAEKAQTSISLYDGRRLAEMRLKAINPTRRTIQGESFNALNAVLFRSPIHGYTPKELAKWEKGDPPVHVYFKMDQEFMPVEMTVNLRFGTITATLEKPAQ